jgi:hypothetical protein
MPATPFASTSRTQGRHRSVTSAVARDQFEILYPTVRGFLLSQFEAHSMPQDAIEYFMRVCRHLLSLTLGSNLLDEPKVSRLQHVQWKV